jgi:protein mago nashi
MLDELRKMITDSAILKESDKSWPTPNKVGRQELEIVMGEHKLRIATSKFGSYQEVQDSPDPKGLTVFWYFVQDIKCFVLSLVNAHFRLKPVS